MKGAPPFSPPPEGLQLGQETVLKRHATGGVSCFSGLTHTHCDQVVERRAKGSFLSLYIGKPSRG